MNFKIPENFEKLSDLGQPFESVIRKGFGDVFIKIGKCLSQGSVPFSDGKKRLFEGKVSVEGEEDVAHFFIEIDEKTGNMEVYANINL
jgi:hypothetical protein